MRLNRPIVGIAATPTGRGYWLVASDGGIFTFGDARFYGSTGGMRLNRPIVGIAATPTGRGYWLVASDGGIFAFGDARFSGSTGGMRLTQPIVGHRGDAGGGGYWLVGEDGGIFAFGGAPFLGSASAAPPQPVVDIAATPTDGYWLATSYGAVHTATENGVFVVDPNLVGSDPRVGDRGGARRPRRTRNGVRADWHHSRGTRFSPIPPPRGHASSAPPVRSIIKTSARCSARAPFAGNFGYLAENIYWGTYSAADAGSAHSGWMHSDGHRAALLTPELQYVGVGVACIGGNKLVAVEEFGISINGPRPPARPTPSLAPFVASDDGGSHC